VGAAVSWHPELFRLAIERRVLETYQIITLSPAWGRRQEKPVGRFFRALAFQLFEET
jgi:hypothetical protein